MEVVCSQVYPGGEVLRVFVWHQWRDPKGLGVKYSVPR